MAIGFVACGGKAPPSGAVIERLSCPPDVPAELAPARDQDLVFVLHAKGVQQYACNGTEWVFVSPSAELFESEGAKHAGKHSAGPTWEVDRSSVVGAKVTEIIVAPDAIPWVLLTATSSTGSGRMARVTSIQRLETSGGLAPATGCDADSVDATTAVKYSADYYFYETRKSKRNVRCGG